MNHRDSWAEEKSSPSREEWAREQEKEVSGGSSSSANNQVVAATRAAGAAAPKTMEAKVENTENTGSSAEGSGKEVLIVASKLKNYIRNTSGMNTSGAVMEILSERVRQLCDQAVENAKRDGRKTVMDRDFGA
jgi:hypothetical protein